MVVPLLLRGLREKTISTKRQVRFLGKGTGGFCIQGCVCVFDVLFSAVVGHERGAGGDAAGTDVGV